MAQQQSQQTQRPEIHVGIWWLLSLAFLGTGVLELLRTLFKYPTEQAITMATIQQLQAITNDLIISACLLLVGIGFALFSVIHVLMQMYAAHHPS